MFGSQSSVLAEFVCVPPGSILFKKVIKHQKRLGLPGTLLSQAELASSMMFIGISTGGVVLQKTMQILEHDKVVPVMVSWRKPVPLGSKQTRFVSIAVSKEHCFSPVRVIRASDDLIARTTRQPLL